MTGPRNCDARAILAEFPAGWCAQQGDYFRAGDGYGSVGEGASWTTAAASLRVAVLERQRAVAARDLDDRRRSVRWIAYAVLWAALAFALIGGIVETLTTKGIVQ